jgi:hypothetical protein
VEDTVEIQGYSEQEGYEVALLRRLRDAWEEGVGVLKNEKGYTECQRGIDYIEGQQVTLRSSAASKVHDNRIKKVTLETVSAMTDVRPIWNYETSNNKVKQVTEQLNTLSKAWWRNTRSDRKLEDALMFALPGGSGYLAVTYDPDAQDLALVPFDPRDVIPIEPIYSDSIQDWQGVMLRQRKAKSWLKDKFPAKAAAIEAGDLNSWGDRYATSAKGTMTELISSFWQAVKGGGNRTKIEKAEYGVDLLRVYLKDNTRNRNNYPVRMGKPDDPMSYVVEPGEKLYPRGRLIVCTPQTILEDGPNPYVHGKFPVVKLTPDPTPWSILGMPIVMDLIPLQDMLNEILRGMADGVKQWVRRGVVTDTNSMTESNLRKIDTRRDGLKVQVNPTMGDGFKLLDGPQFPPWMTQLIEFLRNEIDDNSGVIGLRQQQNLKTMLPDKDTNTNFEQALSPILKRRARGLEVGLSELADLVKFGFFQFYTQEKRIAILGPDGALETEMLFEPNKFVPEGEVDPDDYVNSLQKWAQQFSFTIAPNSFLNVSHMAQRMLVLQLFRANGIDIWSLWESMDIPRIGMIPEGSVADRMVEARKRGLQPGPTPEMVEASNAAQTSQAIAAAIQAQMMVQQLQQQMNAPQYGPPGGGPGGPGGGAPPPGGAPPTSGVGPSGGRPPSGQAPPQMVTKNGPEGPRTVVSESGR